MDYNAVTDISESSLGAEPVTTTEVKNFLRLEGFTDTNASTSESLSDFDFDDTLIGETITAARETFEKLCGVSIVTKTIVATLTNLKGRIEIPYGPVNSITSLYNSEGSEITSDNYTITGTKFKTLVSPLYEDMVLTYTAGFSDVPKALKTDILRLAGYMYLNRGNDTSVGLFASQLAKNHSRRTWLA